MQLDSGDLGVFELYDVYVFDVYNVYVPAILRHFLFYPQAPYHISFVEGLDT